MHVPRGDEMKSYTYYPSGVCSTSIAFDLEGKTIHNVVYTSGCDGNLKAIGKLVEGMDAKEVISLLKGNDCSGRGTSCADQLAIALEEALIDQDETA